MSRSYKKTPIFGNTTSESEKTDKKFWHRRFRHKTKQILSNSHYDSEQMEDTIFPEINEVSSRWWMSKDGKHHLPYEWMKKNIEYLRKLMSK